MGFLSVFRKSKNVSVIPLNGVIAANMGRRKGLNLNELDKNIEQAFSVKNLKAVALQINSPGGSPVQSEMIANRIRELSDKNDVPVLAFVEDVAASGGYWLACAADEIIASKASIIGSIGVVSSGFGFNKAIEKIGIDRRLYTSGDNKAILDPFLPENSEDIKRLKAIQNELHIQFITFVKSRRGSKIKDDNKEVFTGAFWSGEKSLELGLIDSFGEMKCIIKERFGSQVKIKEFAPKKKFFGFSSLLSGALEMLIHRFEEKSIFNRFGL
ncbi:S49 family peptidase [Alphaproteobacteria bacterium]|nr:S49 family peptidase [Alphaproteobacteria bacterium]